MKSLSPPLTTKFESNLGKVHTEAFKGALKSYDRKESRHPTHLTLADVDFSQGPQGSQSMDGKRVRTPHREKTNKISENELAQPIVQKPTDKAKEPLETFSTLSHTESIAREIISARPQFFRHSPTSSIKPEFKSAQTLDLPQPFRAIAPNIFIFSTYQSPEKLVFQGRKRSASSAMSPTFFESRHPQKRARVTRQTLYFAQDIPPTQPNFVTRITPSQFNIHFLSKVTAQPIAITSSTQSQRIKPSYTLTDLDWIEFDIFDYEISLTAERSNVEISEQVNNSPTQVVISGAVFEKIDPVKLPGYTIASDPLKTSMRDYTISNIAPYQGQSGIKPSYTLTDLDWIEFDIFDYEISRKVETSERITQEEINNSTTAEATSYAVSVASELMQPTEFAIASNPLHTSMGVYTVSSTVPDQGQMGFIEGPQKENNSTPKEVHFENVIETPIDFPKPVIYTISPNAFMTSWRMYVVRPGVISHQAKEGFIDDPQIQLAQNHGIQNSFTRVKKNTNTPRPIITDHLVLDTSVPTEDINSQTLTLLGEAKKDAQNRLQKYKISGHLIEALNENYIQKIEGLIANKEKLNKQVETKIKRLRDEIISTINVLIDNTQDMISDISNIAAWKKKWQEEWNSLNQQITDIFHSVASISEEFASKKEDLKSKRYKVQIQLDSILEDQNNTLQELKIIKQDIRSVEEQLNITETALELVQKGILVPQNYGIDEQSSNDLLKKHIEAFERSKNEAYERAEILEEEFLKLTAQEKTLKAKESKLKNSIEALEDSLITGLQEQDRKHQELLGRQKNLGIKINRVKDFITVVQLPLSTIKSSLSSLKSAAENKDGNIPNTSDLLKSATEIMNIMQTSKEAGLLKKVAPKSFHKAIDAFTTAKENIILLENTSKDKDKLQKKHAGIQERLTWIKSQLDGYLDFKNELEEDCKQKQMAESTLLTSISEILREIRINDEWQEIPAEIESRIKSIISAGSSLKEANSDYQLKMKGLKENMTYRRSLAPHLKSLDDITAF